MSDVTGAESIEHLVRKAHWAAGWVCVARDVMAKTTAHQDLFKWRSGGATGGQTDASVCVYERGE